jgi:hypothetical protein
MTTSTAPTVRPAEADTLIARYRGVPAGITQATVEFIDGFSVTAWFAAEDFADWSGDEFRYGVPVMPHPQTGKTYGFWFETAYWLPES